MIVDGPSLILGSRSPRRRELLSLLVPSARMEVVVPVDDTEAGFDGLETMETILPRLAGIARTKNEAVREQLVQSEQKSGSWGAVLTADTVVIAQKTKSRSVVLGKPDGPDWQETTRNWFLDYYSERTHRVATAVCLTTADGSCRECRGLTEVDFGPVTAPLLDWYLATREPLGKAGGYGLQGAAALFVTAVRGSPSNVIGLPLLETWQLLHAAQLC